MGHRVYAYLRHLHRAETTKAPGSPGPLMVGRYGRLLKRGVDRAELGAQTATDAVDCTDDRERNAGCNQAVFNGGRAGFILHETRDKVLHKLAPCVHVAGRLTLGLAAFS